ncbi:glycosyltransferase family 2 protein [Mediterraneibacter agrestimuris]|uniref:glycosyltransferase family 2 protein n=1 Tax=Mediterraneibacter agrestimuris TaxID=2941333 RepID=UPI00203E99D5|nr:glycosyltransferase family 2 protein [Mediterraneibacter agrestimuris]
MKRLSFVIPCYCSETMIGDVIQRIVRTVSLNENYSYEIICINDASKDNTFQVLKECATVDKNIKVLNFSKNYGQHAALMAGFHYVSGDIVICLDDDGQNPPEEMFKLIDKLEEGYDLVSAKYVKENRGFIREVGSKISFAMATYLISKPKDIELNSYYVFRSYILEYITKYQNPYPFVHGQILQVTQNMANVELPRAKRQSGTSGYSLKKLISLWMNGFTAFSEKPLLAAGYVGIIAALIGFFIAFFTIIQKIIHPEIAAGYTSLMACILFMGGIILIFLGLIGEYIGRIYISINNVPQYAIKEKVNITEESKNK